MGLYPVALTTLQISPRKLTITVTEVEQILDVGECDSKEQISCPQWTK